MSDTFLRQQAKTQHFSLGAPRNLTLTKSGDKLFFVRSKAGDDAKGCLWMMDLTETSPTEQLLVDPSEVGADENLPEAERRRRERMREAAGGIVAFSIDDTGMLAAFTLGGELYVVGATAEAEPRQLATNEPVFDPRLSPDGKHIAYVSEGKLQLIGTQLDARPITLASDNDPHITWGMAEFIAAEEMDRLRGFWWAPDGHTLIAARVDNNPVQKWYIADPANPGGKPTEIRYPAAGTSNVEVSLSIVDLQGNHTSIKWDTEKFEYLVDVLWRNEKPLIMVQSRDQKTVQLREVELATGATTLVDETTDPAWVELLGGLPRQLADGTLVKAVAEETWRLQIGDRVVTPPELNVRGVVGVLDDDSVLFSAHRGDPTAWHMWQVTPEGEPRQLTDKASLHVAAGKGQTLLLRSQKIDSPVVTTTLLRQKEGEWQVSANVASHAAEPLITPRPAFHQSKIRKLESALLLPENYNGNEPLPIILDPYGGPHAQRVLAASRAYLGAQWWANQGFAVLITDGRGTPGRGPEWEKAIAGDLITPILDDQIEALHDLAAQDDRLDLKRVGIKGWSFGGYLAAYAVVRHPDVFHAAVAGAPVTDWRLYDTHYTERYLGDPATNAAAYDACSLLKEASKLERPLLLVHGLADDNVVVAHSLQFSSALLAAGRPHQVLPLSGATHMASGDVIAENLEKLQLEFFQRHL